MIFLNFNQHKPAIGKSRVFSFILIGIAIIVSSCNIAFYPELKRIENRNLKEKELYSPFNIPEKGLFYRTSIDVYGKHLSGILIIKKTDASWRTVFINEIGMKFFDFEFFENQEESFKVNSCMSIFSEKKAVIKVLQEDLSRMLMNRIAGQEFRIYKDKNDAPAYRTKIDKNKNYFFTDPSGKIKRIETCGRTNKKTIITYEYNEDPTPEIIKIDHKNIRLMMEFRIMKKD